MILQADSICIAAKKVANAMARHPNKNLKKKPESSTNGAIIIIYSRTRSFFVQPFTQNIYMRL